MKIRSFIRDLSFSLATLFITFFLNLLLQRCFQTQTLIPMIFVLGVFIISWRTQGYFWGVTSSLISVLAVNYAFTYPYYDFDLISPTCLSSAVVMLIVSIMTGTLTTQIKQQEQIKAEAERERMRGNLLRAVSHDLRTPLTSISGASATVIENYESLSDGERLDFLRSIQNDAQWLIRMVENLLSVTRIDGRTVRLSKMSTSLEELIDAVMVKFRKRYPEQAVQVSIPEEFISIPMDPMLMEQVLMNLLENAVLHAEGMQTLSLTVTRKNHLAEFCVSDDGCGIAAERMGMLFTGHFDSAAPPSDGGRSNMGIGLSVCGAIVKAHGSEITVKNLVPHGAAFSFALETEDFDEQ